MALIDDLVAWWAMEDAADSHGSNDLSNSGVSFATGKVNNAGDFDDDSSLTISSAGTGSLRPGTSDFSISLWMYNRSYPEAYNPILFFGAGSSSDPGFTVAHRNTGRLYVFLADGTSRNSITHDTLSLDTWYHLVINVDRDGSITLYVNGSLVASGTPPDQGSPVDLQPTVSWTFGNGFVGYWDGLIDEVGYWHRLLTPEEIAELYNGGDGITYGDFASGDIQGEGSLTDGAETISGAGSVAIAGSGSAADGGETISSAGSVAIVGSGSIVDAGETIAGSSESTTTGSGALTDGGETIAGSGAAAAAGTGALEDAGEAVAAQGNVTITGTGELTDQAEIISGSGLQPSTGSGAVADAGETISGAGSVLVSGQGAVADGGETLTAGGKTLISGAAAVNDAGELVDGLGNVLISGSGSVLDLGETVRGFQVMRRLHELEASLRDVISIEASIAAAFDQQASITASFTLTAQLEGAIHLEVSLEDAITLEPVIG